MRRYNLPLNNKYTFIEITDQGEGNYQICDNCGAFIRYVAHIKDINDKHYFVGTECVQTLQKAQISNEYSMNEQIRAFKKLSQAKNLIETNIKLKTWASSKYIILVGLNKNLKPVKLAIEKLFDPFLGTSYAFIDSFIEEMTPKSITDDWCYNDIFVYFDQLKKQSL